MSESGTPRDLELVSRVKVRVISPHLDDAVWSASGILDRHEATVVTICAGVPPKSLPPNDFDRRAGFESAEDAMLVRREEDIKAISSLSCFHRHLDLLDISYALGEDLAEAVDLELRIAQSAGEIVVGPLGLRHPDHQLIATAFRRGVQAMPGISAWVYEELPYAYVWSEYLAAALKTARCGETTLTRLSPGAKGIAVSAYVSQLRGAHRDAIMSPERYHRLSGWNDV